MKLISIFSAVYLLSITALSKSYLPTLTAPGALTRSKELAFKENKGQIVDQYGNQRQDIDFEIAAQPGLNIFIGKGHIHYQFSKPMNQDFKTTACDRKRRAASPIPLTVEMYRMDMELVGCNENATVVMTGERNYYENYIKPGTGEHGVKTVLHSRIVYRDVYPNIDWVLSTKYGQLEYEFLVREGGNPSDIQLRYDGATALKLINGSLLAETPQGTISEQPPISYQEDGKPITSSFALNGQVATYEVGKFSNGLVIDPTIGWSTYYGGTGDDQGNGVCTDKKGNVYLCGRTSSTATIATIGSFQTVYGGGSYDAFVAKFNGAGDRLWATYYGGNNDDYGCSVAIDGMGNIVMAGETSSTTGIATTGGWQTTIGDTTGYNPDAFIVKFDSTGMREWGTYFGGFGYDWANSMTIDLNNNIFITGITASTSHIVSPGAFQTVYGGSFEDAFIAKFSSSGSRQWATYYGGNGIEWGSSIVADSACNIYVTGTTTTITGFGTPGTEQPSYGGGPYDAFLAKFDSAGMRAWSTYFGGYWEDGAQAVALDGSGNIYMGAYTTSFSGLATAGAFQSSNGSGYSDEYNAILVKFTNAGIRDWSTYYGAYSGINSLCTDSSGNVFLGGQGGAYPATITADAYQPTYGGGVYDGYLAEFSNSGTHMWGTYFGGSDKDFINSITRNKGDLYIGGASASTSGISSAGAWQLAYGGATNDAFLAKFSSAGRIRGIPAVCVGATTFMSDSVAGGIWNSSDSSVASVSSSGVVTGIDTGTAIISYSVYGSVATIIVTVVIAPGPILGNLNVCIGSTTIFSDAVPGGTWNSEDTSFGIIDTLTGTFSAIVAGEVKINYLISCGSASVIITTNPLPVILVSPDSAKICFDSSVQLLASGGSTYLWTPGTGLSCGTCANPIAMPLGSTIYNLKCTSSYGCIDSANVFIAIDTCTTETMLVSRNDEIRIYPNPAANILVIVSSAVIRAVSIENIVGQTLFVDMFDNKLAEINVAELPPGSYLIRINSNIVRKFVKL